MNEPEIPEPITFEWDTGNQDKSLKKHGITNQEGEETFFSFKQILPDQGHSKAEQRFGMLGKTSNDKVLFIVFTIRTKKVRIISARVADKKERNFYEQASKKAA
jgi:uncharacterized DUF497 family protein